MNDNLEIRNGVLISYTGSDFKINIPDGVARVGKKAFLDSNIQEISFEGETLRSIDDEAFFGCKNLESIHIPNGVVQIGDRAFCGCSRLEYIVIPDSVIVVGDDILGGCKGDLLIIGNDNAEAGKIAKHFNLAIKSELKETISAHLSAKRIRASVENKSFDIFGEIITCSNSLAKYQENLEFYLKRKQAVFNKFFSQFPMDIFQPFGNLVSVLEEENNLVINRLASQGIFVSQDVINSYVLEPYKAILDAAKAIKKAHDTVAKDVANGISNDRSDLLREAESKVTGLSYGVIGGSLEMIAYSIDDYRARKQQREEAYAVANQKLAASRQKHTSHGNQVYTKLLAKAAPSLHQGTDMLIDALCFAENDQLMKAGILDPAIKKNVDIAKSVQLMESIVNDLGDNLFTVALAIKKYPCNMAALTYAYDHGHMCEGLSDLVSFLQLQNKIEAGIKESRKTRLKKLQNKMNDVQSGNEGVLIIQENARLLDDADVKQLLRTLASQKISPLIENLTPAETDNVVDSDEYWGDLLARVITEDNWKYYQLQGIQPVISGKIPNTVAEDYAQLRSWIAEKVKKERIIAEQYAEYLKKYPDVVNLDKYKKRRWELEILLPKYFASVWPHLAMVGGIALMLIAGLLAGILDSHFSDGLVGLTLMILFVGLLLSIIGYANNFHKKYSFGQAYKGYTEGKKEINDLNNKINAILKVPTFEGTVPNTRNPSDKG